MLDDFLVAENSPYQTDIDSPVLTSERASIVTSPRFNDSGLNSYGPFSASDDKSESVGIRLLEFLCFLLYTDLLELFFISEKCF